MTEANKLRIEIAKLLGTITAYKKEIVRCHDNLRVSPKGFYPGGPECTCLICKESRGEK